MKKSYSGKYFTIHIGNESPHNLQDYDYDILFHSNLVQPPTSIQELKDLSDFILDFLKEHNENKN